MGYSIEVSFNIIKNNSVTDIQEMVKTNAEKYGCQYIYHDYEYEINTQFKRNHCIITINFQKTDILNLIEFLKFIRSKNYLYIESVFSESPSVIIFASQYYRTQKINKSIGKIFKKENYEFKYSIEEIMILNTIKNCKSFI
jgi:hypothetical protein